MENEVKWFCERYKLYELMKSHPNNSYHWYARELGKTPKWARKWVNRFRESDEVNFQTFQSHSRAPKRKKQSISEEAKDIVVQLREELSEKWNRKAGSETIKYEIQRLEKQNMLAIAMPKSQSTITRILRERGFILPKQNRFRYPLCLPNPMEEWEIDFGERQLDFEHIFEFFIVADRGTSRLVYLEGSYGYRAESTLEALFNLFSRHGLPKRLRFDRDPRLWGAWTRDSYPSPMVRMLHVLGVEPVPCPPRRPDKKPIVERLIYTFKHEWLDKHQPKTLGDALDACVNFSPHYNTERPHQGVACDNRPPDTAFPNLPTLPQLPATVNPNAWLNALKDRVFQRRVSSEGTIQVDRHYYYVGREFAKQSVALLVDLNQREFKVTQDAQKVLKRLPIQGLQEKDSMDFFEFLKITQQEAHYVEWHYQSVWKKRSDESA